jgi:hypothetical protein
LATTEQKKTRPTIFFKPMISPKRFLSMQSDAGAADVVQLSLPRGGLRPSSPAYVE